MTVYKQTQFHRPCGHWHLRLFEETPGGYAKNCWMPSLAVDGTSLFFVAAGKHMDLYAETGCDIYMFEYNIGANIWTLIYHEENSINAANKPGGTGFDNGIYMFANYKADAHGTRLIEYYDNLCIGVWVSNGTTMNYTEFAAPEQYLQNKVGCYTGGMAAFAYEDAAGQLLVEVSTDYGATWNLRKTVGALAARQDFSLFVEKTTGYIFLAHQTAANTFMLERSIDNGLNWTTIEAGETLLTSFTRMKFVKEDTTYFIFGMNATTSVAKYSTNGTTWTTITGYADYYSITASGGYVDTHRSVNVVSGYMGNYMYDDDAAAYAWNRREVPGYLPLSYNEGSWVDDLLEYLGTAISNRETADLNGQNGVYAYASYGFYSSPSVAVSIAISLDEGETWFVRQTPLRYFGSGDEITDFDGNPADWAERFVRQRDKYEHWRGL